MTHWLTYLLTRVKCRATSVAKNGRFLIWVKSWVKFWLKISWEVSNLDQNLGQILVKNWEVSNLGQKLHLTALASGCKPGLNSHCNITLQIHCFAWKYTKNTMQIHCCAWKYTQNTIKIHCAGKYTQNVQIRCKFKDWKFLAAVTCVVYARRDCALLSNE